MKKFALVSLAAALLSTGAIAQQHNGFPAQEPSTGNADWHALYDFGPDRLANQAPAMQRIRALCASDRQSSEQRCARVKRAMDQRFAEIYAREAA